MIHEHDSGNSTARTLDYPNAFDDPDPVLPSLMFNEVEAHDKVIVAFGDEPCDVFTSDKVSGEELWTDFICTLRPHFFQICPKNLTYK